MKTTLFVLGCLTIAMASCGSPEERAASNTTTETAATTTAAPETAAATTDTAATSAPAPDTAAKPETAPATAAAPAAKADDTSVGKALLAKADCLACHSVSQKIVGPAYENVAAKYPATDENIDHLVEKIIAGGQGVWGAVPMTPHPSLSKTDAKEMVKYILSLKK